MMLSFDSAISALDQFQTSLNNTANNIANVNTTGYKTSSVTFQDAFSQTLGGAGTTGVKQVGTGVGTESITNQFTPGSTSSTGNTSDVAITGTGFFTVRDPGTGATFATRDGHFQNVGGFLSTSSGLRVQGYTAAGSTTVGDIPVTAPTGSTANAVGFSFNQDGTMTIDLDDNSTTAGGQVLLQNYSTPQNLLKVGGNLFSNLASAGPLAAPVVPSTNTSAGYLATSSLEMSNVDLAAQLAQLIITQRAYEANTKVISTSDQVMQTINNLVR